MGNLMACWADTASSSPGLCFYGDLRVSFAPDYQIYCSLSIALIDLLASYTFYFALVTCIFSPFRS